MNFLLDMNISRSLGRRLEAEGHRWWHVADIGAVDADDSWIVEEARRRDAVILTYDLDFGKLLAFAGTPKPSVVILRGLPADPATLWDRMSRTSEQWEGWVHDGAVVVLDPDKVRIRRLPLGDR